MYGRARRIKLIIGILLSIMAIVGIFIGLNTINTRIKNKKQIKDFDKLRIYMYNRGFICENLKSTNSKCTLKTSNGLKIFIKKYNGFELDYVSKNYTINLIHYEKNNKISFITNSNALSGYKNKKFTCTNNNILDQDIKCTDDEEEELKQPTYLSEIQRIINEADEIITNSGYNKQALINNYEWRVNK